MNLQKAQHVIRMDTHHVQVTALSLQSELGEVIIELDIFRSKGALELINDILVFCHLVVPGAVKATLIGD